MHQLNDAYHRMLSAFGRQHWWPGESRLEIVVGAVLTQNTAWKNVERALDQLRQAGALQLDPLQRLTLEELAELIRPAGYYRLKAKRLKNLLRLIKEQYAGSLDFLLAQPADSLREVLLSVNGIGPETADSIVLYAAELPVFVVDTYTSRVLKRHGWIEWEADYYAMQDLFHDQLDADPQLYNEYHALLVRVGKEFCGRQPRCDDCPLQPLLPADGPLENEFC